MRKTNKSTAIYATPFSGAYWKDAFAELKDTRILVFAALMIALRVAMKPLGIHLAPNVTINIAFFANALGAMVFGPVVAIFAAMVSDTLGCLLFPTGPYFLPFILTEIGGSLIFALFLYRCKVTPTRVILSRFCIDFFINIVLNAPIMWLYYKFMMGKSYIWFQVPHILKNLFMFPVESVLLTLFLALMIPIFQRSGMMYTDNKSLKFQKAQIVVLVALFAVGIGSVAGYLVYNYNHSNQVSWLETQEKVEMNAALTEEAEELGLLEDNQIVVIHKVNRQFHGDSDVTFQIYEVSPETDLEKAAAYRSKEAKGDETLTLVGTGTAHLPESKTENVENLTIELEEQKN